MGMRFVITVNRDAVDKGDPNPVRVEDTLTGTVTHHARVQLGSRGMELPEVVSGPRRQDGATVWIEAAAVEPLDTL